MEKRISITASDIREMVTKAVSKILCEAKKAETLISPKEAEAQASLVKPDLVEGAVVQLDGL